MEEVWFVENGKRRRGEEYVCENCNCSFTRRKNGKKVFCSKQCSYQSRYSRITVKCRYCGAEFERKKSSLAKSRSQLHFCNRKCKDKAQSIRGGCKEIQPDHYSEHASNYRWIIAEAKEPKCCDCEDDRKWSLLVHHIDGNRKNNDPSNLEIVCGTCHIKRHLVLIDDEWIYSSKYLTPRDELQNI